MNSAYKPIWVIIALFTALAVMVGISKWNQKPELIPWRTDFTAARTEASQSGKPVFMYLTATWCGPCQGMKTTTWADLQVDAALHAYVPLKIDVDSNPDLVKKYLYTPDNPQGAIPAFRVLGTEAQINKQAAGAMNAAEFLKWLGG
jgi:thiol:disulfide interchange protein